MPDPDFPQLMTQLRARLHRYCARMTGSVLDGEDIVQVTLIKANDSYDASQIKNVEGWLFRIAHIAYAKRFNARDFDGLRDMLGACVQLDLPARRKPIPARDGEYFTRYAKQTQRLVATPVNFDALGSSHRL